MSFKNPTSAGKTPARSPSATRRRRKAEREEIDPQIRAQRAAALAAAKQAQQ